MLYPFLQSFETHYITLFFLFDKQQYHVRHFFLHFNVDTIIRLSVILQYLVFFFFYFVLRYIKKHQLQT